MQVRCALVEVGTTNHAYKSMKGEANKEALRTCCRPETSSDKRNDSFFRVVVRNLAQRQVAAIGWYLLSIPTTTGTMR